MTTLEEIEKFEDWFSFCFKDENLPIEETIIELKKFVIFFSIQSDKLIELIRDLERRQAEQIATTMFQKEKRFEKFLKQFLKRNSQFVEVPEREGCDSILFVNEDDINHSFVVRNVIEDEEDITEKIEKSSCRVVYLKNRNKHHIKKAGNSHIKNLTPNKKI